MASVLEFLAQKKLAVVGVSRSGKKFGNVIYRELTSKGYAVYAVNSRYDGSNEKPFFPDLLSLPEKVGGAVIVVKPDETLKVAGDAVEAGITHIWMQRGAESDEAVRFCRENGINVVHGECILMFAEPVVSFHKFHRFIRKLRGKLPK